MDVSCSIKEDECWRIDAFELWCWRRLLRVPWTAKRSNESVLKEISPEYSLEELILKLKFHTFATWCEELTHWKYPDAGKEWRQEEKETTEDEMVGWQHWLNGHEFEQAPGDCDGQRNLACCSPWDHKKSDKSEQLNKKWNSNLACQQLTLNPHIKKLQKSNVLHIKPSF